MASHQQTSGGRADVRRLFVFAGFVLAIGSHVAPLKATDARSSRDIVTVREERGIYFVDARFDLSATRQVVRAVLTDYNQIPRFMPGVMRSHVLDQIPGRTIVEQEAVSRFMMFSKRVHIVLEITEGTDVLTFRDQCGRSFARYEGRWQLSDGDRLTAVRYELVAQPSFEVPDFVLKRLLKRDAGHMIEGLRREIATRSKR
jgi:ribosome-associated toxin RatA of RatAB toxin-antitoxin module